MNQTEISNVYKMISYFLNYPDQQMAEVLPALQKEIESLHDPLIKESLREFTQICGNKPLNEWIIHYIEHFDFGKKTNLYVTYLKLGEQRERGLELLKLKKFYEAAGFGVTEKELPDYLPLMLEFCANVPVEKSNELLTMNNKAMQEIKGKLEENKSYYALLFKALFLQMDKNGVVFSSIEEPKEAEKEKKKHLYVDVSPFQPDRKSLMNAISWNIHPQAKRRSP